jgi:hypothetical protein
MMRLDERLEDLMEAGFATVRRRYGGWRGRRVLGDKSYLRGRQCHCPQGMPRHLVHSEGLREGADLVIDFGSNISSPSRMQIPVPVLSVVASQIGGDVVHVKADRMEEFHDHVLPQIARPIVLVTGDSDYAPVRRFAHLLDETRIIHWFAQNCDLPGRHPKLTRIPIGIDNPRYTKLDKRVGFVLTMLAGKTPFDPTVTRNDMGDQALLQAIAAETGRRIEEKPLKALCTFHLNQKFIPNIESLPDRQEAVRSLRDNPLCHFIERRLPQDECWRMHGDFAFEISPRGKGLDCFRTWECLVLGTIPIVKSSTLDPLFVDEKFPVAIVQSFDEVTPANLARWRDELAPLFTAEMLQRLTNDYWLDRIRAAMRVGSPR